MHTGHGGCLYENGYVLGYEFREVGVRYCLGLLSGDAWQDADYQCTKVVHHGVGNCKGILGRENSK